MNQQLHAVEPPQERKMKRLGAKAGAALEHAAEALGEYVSACREGGEQLRLDDDRLITRERCADLGAWLTRVFGPSDGR